MAIQSRSLSDIAVITRASNASYFDSNGILKIVSTNQARTDYSPSSLTSLGLLVEEQRTNLTAFSQYFNSWQFNYSPIIKPNIGTAPSGAANATEMTATTSGEGIYSILTTTSGTKYSLSMFMKNISGASSLRFGCDLTPSNGWITVNLVTGVISSSGAGVIKSSIQSLPNGWYRVSVTFSSTSTSSSFVVYNISGSTAKWYIWGAQSEVGEFSTSYISTNSTFGGRASTANFFNANGDLESAAIDVARYSYNPSNLTASPFFLAEAEKTNSIRNNTSTGAVAGYPGTMPTNWLGNPTTNLNRAIIGTGTENGIAYLDVAFFGVVTSSRTQNIFFDATTAIAATNNQDWTLSSFIKIIGGSLNNISSISLCANAYSNTPTYLNDVIDSSFTPVLGANLNTQRFSATGTTSNASTAYIVPFIKFITSSYGLVYIILRIGLPQMELGSFPSSPIQTSSAAVTRSSDAFGWSQTTRAVDNLYVSTLPSWYNKSEGTLYAEVAIKEVGTSSYPWSTAIDDGTGTNRLGFYFVDAGADTYNKKITTNGVGQVDEAGTVVLTPSTFVKGAMAIKLNDFAAAFNGGAVQTDTSVELSSNLTRLLIGNGDNRWNGWIRRLSYYPRRLTNAELQALTST